MGATSSRMPAEHVRSNLTDLRVTSSSSEQPNETAAAASSISSPLPNESTTASSSAVTVVVVEDAAPVVAALSPAAGAPQPSCGDGEPSEAAECVICLSEVGPDGTTLDCQHRFHEACITEWLDKDGRCPVCRHQVREPVATLFDGIDQLPNGIGGLRSLASTGLLILDSRRLMMLGTMEAALAILVMSYVADLLSPALMIMAAVILFFGASYYLPRVTYVARPILFLNATYHVYILSHIIYRERGIDFFGEEYGSARTILLSIACITFMELAALKKVTSFHTRLVAMPPLELRALRMQRRYQQGWAQRVIVGIMFVLIFAPLVARYVCGTGRMEDPSSTCRHA